MYHHLSAEQVDRRMFCRGTDFGHINTSVKQWENLFSSLTDHFAGIEDIAMSLSVVLACFMFSMVQLQQEVSYAGLVRDQLL